MAMIPRPDEVDTKLAQKVVESPQPYEVGSKPTPEVVATADIEEERERMRIATPTLSESISHLL